MRGWGSIAVWNFSENSSVLEGEGVPYGSKVNIHKREKKLYTESVLEQVMFRGLAAGLASCLSLANICICSNFEKYLSTFQMYLPRNRTCSKVHWS